MNPWLGWSIAITALVAGWFASGARGVALAVTVIAFWLLLQFNRLVRVMRRAAEAPVGQVDSAVMLHARLQTGLPMAEVVAIARSLGHRVDLGDELYTWADAGGASVRVTFKNGRCASWLLVRTPD